MNKKIINKYIFYTAKKPILFITVVCLGIFIILYLTLTIKTNVIKVYDGIISKNTIHIPEEIKRVPKRIYLYNDKNEAIYPVEVIHTEYKMNSTAIYIVTNSGNIPFTDSTHVKVDIPIQQTTLFARVFLKGGKIDE